MMSIHGKVVSAVLILLSVALSAGCDGAKGAAKSMDRPYTYDSPVAQRLEEFHRAGPQGAERRLEDLTDFQWDTVHLFSEGDSYSEIDANVGTKVFEREGPYIEQGSLLIFTSEGRLAHAVAIVPPFVNGRAYTYHRQSAVLRAHTKDPGPYQLVFAQ